MTTLATGKWRITVSVSLAAGVTASVEGFNAATRAWRSGTADLLPEYMGLATGSLPNPNTQLVDLDPREANPARKRHKIQSNIVVDVLRPVQSATLGTLVAKAINASGVDAPYATLARAMIDRTRPVLARIDAATLTWTRVATSAPATPRLPSSAPATPTPPAPPPEPIITNPPPPVTVEERLAGATVVQASQASDVGKPPPTALSLGLTVVIAVSALVLVAVAAYALTRKAS